MMSFLEAAGAARAERRGSDMAKEAECESSVADDDAAPVLNVESSCFIQLHLNSGSPTASRNFPRGFFQFVVSPRASIFEMMAMPRDKTVRSVRHSTTRYRV
jgi:hypothetical protein